MTHVTAEVLEGFSTSILMRNYEDPAPTPEFHREIWRYICSDHPKVAIAAPRSHAKSTVVTHAYILASVLFREQSYVVIVSDTVSQSVQFLGDIKKELTDNDDLRTLFGIKEFIKDTEDDLIVNMDDNHLFRIQAKGSEQKLRGLKWKNMRPGLIVMDDGENDEIVMNRDRRLKFKRWFYGALLPALSDKGKIRIVGTILHLDSLLENLMPASLLKGIKNGYKSIVHEDLKEYTNSRVPWKSIKYRAHTDDFKQLLWPEKKSALEFKLSKEDYARQGLADVYSQEMLNIPIDEDNTYFKKQDFLPMRNSDRSFKLIHYIACDLAVSQSQTADYSAFVVGGMDENGRLHVVHVIKERMDAMQIVDTMLALNKAYKPMLFAVEKGLIEKSIGPYLRETMLKRNQFLNMFLISPTGDKMTKAKSIQARMRAGAVRFDMESDWFQAFQDELVRFPRDRHDDQVDAFAYLGLMLDKMLEAPTEREQEDEDYDEMVKTFQTTEMLGRSDTTGY